MRAQASKRYLEVFHELDSAINCGASLICYLYYLTKLGGVTTCSSHNMLYPLNVQYANLLWYAAHSILIQTFSWSRELPGSGCPSLTSASQHWAFFLHHLAINPMYTY